MNKERGLDMAVPYKVCPVTGEHMDAGIYIRTTGPNSSNMPLVTEENQTLHKQLHGQCIGISEVLSAKALADIGDGFYLIEFDPAQTTEDDLKRGNPYKTGRVVGLKRHLWEEFFINMPFPENQWAYCPAPFVQELQEYYSKL